MKWNSTQALSEGWDVFETEHLDGPPQLEILKLDDPTSIPDLGYVKPKFKSDEAAVAFVTKKAKSSAYHARALHLHGQKVQVHKRGRK